MNFLVLGVFLVLLIGFMLLTRRAGARNVPLREVEGWKRLPGMVGEAVEAGRRVHLSLGTGVLGQTDTATVLAGLQTASQVAAVTVVSDRPPVITTTDGAAMMLAQDTIKQAYKQQHALDQYRDDGARVAALSPAAFGAALSTLVRDEAVAGNLLIGSVGPEVVLLTEAGRRAGITTLAGSDNLTGQAALFAAADATLVGEDLYTAGAFLQRGDAQVASLRAQDVMRLLLIGGMLVGVVLKTLGIF